MKKILSFIVISFLTAEGIGQQENPEELITFREELDHEIEKILKPKLELQVAYERHLKKQCDVFQKAGKLKEVITTEKELNGFRDGVTNVAKSPELAKLQQIYLKELQKIEKTNTAEAGKISAHFSERANKIAFDLTLINQIEKAKIFKREGERLARVAARQILDQSLTKSPGMATGFDDFEGSKAGENFRNGIGMRFSWVPAGTFLMGSPPTEVGHQNNEKQAEITIEEGFWIGKHEVKQEFYEKVTGTNPSKHLGDELPVEQVTWKMAKEFCEKLTKSERERGDLPNNWRYDLPTEPQWEYACRAGGAEHFCGEPLEDYAWYRKNNDWNTRPIGEKKPNEWGIHDMHGNVREWCRFWVGERYQDGPAPKEGNIGVQTFRGGFFNSPEILCRAAARGPDDARGTVDVGLISSSIGFRIVIVIF